jgi:predicted ferric reductase
VVAVKFRGLDPRTRLVRWALFGTAVAIVLAATAGATVRELASVVALYHDSLPWFAMRLLGFGAYLAMTASVIYGLLMSTRLLDEIAHRPISFALHQDLSSVGLGLAGVHGALLLLDRIVPFTFVQVAVPGLAPYRAPAVALGQLAFTLMLAVVASFYLRRRIGQKTWRTLHYVTFVAFLGATVHGLLSGTDSAQPWAAGTYLVSTIVVVSLLVFRLVLVVTARATGRSGPAVRAAAAQPVAVSGASRSP